MVGQEPGSDEAPKPSKINRNERRGLQMGPKLAIGDGALRSWASGGTWHAWLATPSSISVIPSREPRVQPCAEDAEQFGVDGLLALQLVQLRQRHHADRFARPAQQVGHIWDDVPFRWPSDGLGDKPCVFGKNLYVLRAADRQRWAADAGEVASHVILNVFPNPLRVHPEP